MSRRRNCMFIEQAEMSRPFATTTLWAGNVVVGYDHCLSATLSTPLTSNPPCHRPRLKDGVARTVPPIDHDEYATRSEYGKPRGKVGSATSPMFPSTL